MALVKIGSRNQVVLPPAVRKRLGVSAGDQIEIWMEGNKAWIKPKRKRKAAAWPPYTDEPLGPEMRAGLEEALKEVREGKVLGPFKSAEELIEHLHSAVRKNGRQKTR